MAVGLLDRCLVAEFGEHAPGLVGEFRDDLHGVHLATHLGQNGCLEPGPGPDLQDFVAGSDAERLAHYGDDVRLGYGLPIANGERVVAIGLIGQLDGDKPVSGDRAHRPQDVAVLDVRGEIHGSRVLLAVE